MPRIEFEFHWITSENANRILRDTYANIEITVDNKCITRNLDRSSNFSDAVTVSTDPIAYWLAFSWWRISYELLPIDSLPKVTDWSLCHRLSAENWCRLWPNIVFISDGEYIQIQMEPFRTEGKLSDYFSTVDNSIYIPIAQFQSHIDHFIDKVLDRLIACNHHSTELKTLWQILKVDRSNPEVHTARRVEAMLGYDAHESPPEWIQKFR